MNVVRVLWLVAGAMALLCGVAAWVLPTEPDPRFSYTMVFLLAAWCIMLQDMVMFRDKKRGASP